MKQIIEMKHSKVKNPNWQEGKWMDGWMEGGREGGRGGWVDGWMDG